MYKKCTACDNIIVTVILYVIAYNTVLFVFNVKDLFVDEKKLQTFCKHNIIAGVKLSYWQSDHIFLFLNFV